EPFFALAPPKSTGRDLFHGAWLDAWLHRCGPQAQRPARAADVQATLCELTAVSCLDAMLQPGAGREGRAPAVSEVVVCGGGAFNGLLMRRLQAGLSERLGQGSTEALVVSSGER